MNRCVAVAEASLSKLPRDLRLFEMPGCLFLLGNDAIVTTRLGKVNASILVHAAPPPPRPAAISSAAAFSLLLPPVLSLPLFFCVCVWGGGVWV